MILLVLESHGTLHFSRRIDEGPQGIAGKRMVVAAGVDVLQLSSLVIPALGIGTLKQKSFNLIGRVQGIALLFILFLGKGLEHRADVAAVRISTLVDDLAKNQHL